MRSVASVSFGKDSLAMLLLLLERNIRLDEVIFYNSEMEFQAIYDIRDRMKPILEQRGIRFTEVKPGVPFLYNMLERPVDSKKNGFHLGYGWCGGLCRWGTKLKTNALDGIALDAEVHYVGIAADEPERLKRLELPKCSPLAEAGMTESDCLAYCYSRGFFWEENGIRLYDILDRVSCWCCKNKNRKELKNIYQFLPQYWKKLKELQAQIPMPMKPYSRKGVPYCDWSRANELLRDYHDNEWGIPVHDDRTQFEYLMMEAMQCGLSWNLMLCKREIFRACFDGFDFEKVAQYTEADVERILHTEGMIRSVPKIRAVIHNAKCFLDIRKEFGSFSDYLWAYSEGKTILYHKHDEGCIPVSNDLSDAISKDLKKRGFKYLGSVTVYSHLQACGIINDHSRDCPCYSKINGAYPTVKKRRDHENKAKKYD